MSVNNKSYRVRTNVGSDNVLNVNLNQDFNVLEVLSLKIDADNLYRFHTSDYGCIAGRVLANGNFGIPNAKISIFIAIDSADTENEIISYLYPYKTTSSKNVDKIRYNLLPEDQLSDCHRNVGTFPSKRTVLDDNHVLEVYDKYYKYTTRSNEAGDYMIFGVPTGAQTLHVDIDLSDIGILSQRPRDMVYKGYSITQFENGNMFKKSNNLDTLAQIISQNQNVFVYPFWGEDSEGEIAITRKDIEVQYEFTPTCVFIGSVITDETSNGISKRCIPSERMGKMDRLVTGNGTIEMIRKKPDGTTEEVVIQGNTLIDGSGTWCYQIPMNLDYVKTDEFGHTVPTDDPTRGVATRACVRFRVSLTEFENEGGYSHVSKVLVPHNPKYYTDDSRGDDKKEPILDYVFGSNTDDASFKNLFTNNVYTVKSFIPRFQMLNIDRNKRFSGFKAVNINDNNNPIPYNNIRVDLTFMFTLQCAIFKVLLWIIGIWNWFMSKLWTWIYKKDSGTVRGKIKEIFNGQEKCVYIGEGYCPQMEGWYFAPKCTYDKLLSNTLNYIKNDGDTGDSDGSIRDDYSIDSQNKDKDGERICVTNKIKHFVQCVEINLAMEHEVIQLDFYNDWINGMLYIPRWFADIRPKRSYLFGLIKIAPRVNGCMENGYRAIFSRRYAQQCALEYTVGENRNNFTKVVTPKGCKNDKIQKCHKAKGRKNIKIFTSKHYPSGGVVHDQSVSNNKTAYYFRPCEWFGNKKLNLFATDIVLLGSLDAENKFGIPQSFEKLSSTSYQIPDAIASTNLGVDGFLYGTSNGRDSVCNDSTTTSEVRQLDKTKSGVETWTKGKDFEEASPYDAEEDIVTEAAGIDWGFSGPGQGENDLSKLYFPGGHFLGISCVNSETNIKSCINLSRICEAGSIISQRQTLIQKNGDTYSYRYLIPTGLISGESINDYGFKNEFATLNYNGLKIKKNEETLLNEYDFETVYPINFDGELSDYSKDSTYNHKASNTEYVRTIEESSDDYYRFRLGLKKVHTLDDSKKRFLSTGNAIASLPVFENSFYFYFGLKNGNTAIDRFFKDFYAECPKMKSYEPDIIITLKNPAHLCEDDGSVEIFLKNIEEPSYVVKYRGITKSGITNSFELDCLPGEENIYLEVNGRNITTINRTFTVEMVIPESIENQTYEKNDYTVEKEEFHEDTEGAGNIKFTYNSFSDSNVYGVGVINRNYGQYIKIVENNNYAYSITPDLSRYNILLRTQENTLYGKIVYAWGGNETYDIVLWYCCENEIKEREIGTEIINMPTDLDIVFDDYKYASYRYIIEPLVQHAIQIAPPNLIAKEIARVCNTWYDIVLRNEDTEDTLKAYRKYLKTLPYFSGNEGENRLNLVRYHIKKALFYRDSYTSIDDASGDIKYKIIGGTPPYNMKIIGYGEKIYYNGDNSLLSMDSFATPEDAANKGYDMSINSFISPTSVYGAGEFGSVGTVIQDVPILKGYFVDYSQSNEHYPQEAKGQYSVSISDSTKTLRMFGIPSIYRPFFFRTLYMSICTMDDDFKHTDRQRIYFGVTNTVGLPSPQYGGSTKSRTIVKMSVPDSDEPVDFSPPVHDVLDEYNGGLTAKGDKDIESKYFCEVKSDYFPDSKITNGKYSCSVSEGNDETVAQEIYINANFIGDGVLKYNSDVKYFGINEALFIMINSYASFIDDGPDLYYLPFSKHKGNRLNAWTPLVSELISNYIVKNGGTHPFDGRRIEAGDYITLEDMIDPDYVSALENKLTNLPYVLGIYESDSEYNSNIFGTNIWPITYELDSWVAGVSAPARRHTSRISVLRMYSKDAFIDYVRQTFHS